MPTWLCATMTLFGTMAMLLAILSVIGVVDTMLGPRWGTAFLIILAIGIVPAMCYWMYKDE